MKANSVTARMAKLMKADREAGMTIRAIMAKYDVCASTAMRHTSEAAAEAMRRYERARYERNKARRDQQG